MLELAPTPPESGGQVGDTGSIVGPSGSIDIGDCQVRHTPDQNKPSRARRNQPRPQQRATVPLRTQPSLHAAQRGRRGRDARRQLVVAR
jgi:Ser-tRNA(Ala) deacylase AlaX